MLLPKKDKDGIPYVSYSQINSWNNDKNKYMKQYFFGDPRDSNAYLDFGTKFGEAMETGDFSTFPKEKREFLATIPRLDEFEREIKWEFEGFYLKGFIDTNNVPVVTIIDYKTGDLSKEDYYSSDEYKQLEMYAGAIEQETGKLPEKAKVILVERLGNGFTGTLTLGSSYVEVDKKINRDTIDKVKQYVLDTVEDISRHYKAFLSLTENK